MKGSTGYTCVSRYWATTSAYQQQQAGTSLATDNSCTMLVHTYASLPERSGRQIPGRLHSVVIAANSHRLERTYNLDRRWYPSKDRSDYCTRRLQRPMDHHRVPVACQGETVALFTLGQTPRSWNNAANRLLPHGWEEHRLLVNRASFTIVFLQAMAQQYVGQVIPNQIGLFAIPLEVIHCLPVGTPLSSLEEIGNSISTISPLIPP